jgi:hypothetical protein
VANEDQFAQGRTPGANTITLFVGYSTAQRSSTLYYALNLESLGRNKRAKRGNVITNRAARWSKLALLAAGVFALAGATINPSYAAPAKDTEISIVQGLPGKDLDVAIDQEPPIAQDVKTASVAGPFEVKPGSHTVTFSEDGKTVLKSDFTVKEGSEADLVAHFLASSSSDPRVMVYDKYDAIKVTKGKALLVVTHAATAPPVDIQVNDKALLPNIANGESSQLRVPGATYKVAIVPTGKTVPVYGPISLPVKGGTITHLYVVGDLNQKTLSIAARVLTATPTGSEKPSEVNTGTGGQAFGHCPLLEVNLAR